MKKFNHGRLKLSVVCLMISSFCFLLSVEGLAYAQERFGQTFRKGDGIRLTVWQPWRTTDGNNQAIDLNGDYTIDSRGYVFFPLIGEVSVLSHTTSTLASELKEKFSAYFQDPIIVVEPLIRITMLGAFARPGTYLVKPDASLWEVVDLAGGPEVQGNLEKLSVVRGGKTVIPKLLSGFERAYSIEEIGVRSGDQIVLPGRSSFGFRDVLEILRFGISILQLYLLIERL